MSSPTPRAVMVWVHGGGWYRGGAVKFNMWKITTEAQIIGVSIQYRLGALGFLSTGSTVIPGNYAMLDQVLALEWVKDNIASFGGDINNITIYGQSAGGASVSCHTLSPLSKGLFKRVIMQSGSALGFWTTRTDESKYAYQLAKNVNCLVSQNQSHNAQSDMRMIECLRKIPYRSIVDGSDFNLSLTSYSDDAVWSPVVDNHFLVGEPSRLTDDARFLQSVGFNEYDIMFGVNNAEGGIMVHLAMQYGDLHNISGLDMISKPGYFQGEYLRTVLKRFYGEFLNVDIDVVEFESRIYTAVQQPYPLFNQTAVQVLEQLLNTATLMSAYRIARARDLNNSSGKTFLYFFDHYPAYAKRFYITGISHGDINYSFGINDTLIRLKYNITGNISQEEYLLSDKFVQILAQFGKTGDPNSAVKENLSTVWREFSGPDWSYLSFTTNMEVKTHLRQREAELWLDLIPKLHMDGNKNCDEKQKT
ncbi:cholinesterase 2-like [Haliotis rufescens]|uniref:cholinesterase 2-like n=1 Tax=Haliotis rufescens TaxID=6454 RepID=UPI00201F9389|nr:cholinesterase 2-like [Haliotis rufescens]